MQTDFTTAPRYSDFAQVTANMTPADIANFTMWCWVTKQVPNPTVIAKWMKIVQNKD